MPSSPVCPACGAAPGSSLACLECGAILEERAGATHFERLGLEPAPRVDVDAAEPVYLRLSRVLHPDFQSGAERDVADRALDNSARLNDAWRVLTDEQACAEYAVATVEADALERTKQLSGEFLMAAMEWSERVEDARASGDSETLAAIADEVGAEIARRMDEVAASFGTDADVDALATRLHEARTLRRILRDTEKQA